MQEVWSTPSQNTKYWKGLMESKEGGLVNSISILSIASILLLSPTSQLCGGFGFTQNAEEILSRLQEGGKERNACFTRQLCSSAKHGNVTRNTHRLDSGRSASAAGSRRLSWGRRPTRLSSSRCPPPGCSPPSCGC